MTDVKTIAAGWEPSRVSALRDVMSAMKLDALGHSALGRATV